MLADQVGIDRISSANHPDDFAISAPDIVSTAIADPTERTHLGTTVSVLSGDDPILVFERFPTLDGASKTRLVC